MKVLRWWFKAPRPCAASKMPLQIYARIMCRAHSHRARRERAEAPRRTGTPLAFAPPAKGEVLPANYCLR